MDPVADPTAFGKRAPWSGCGEIDAQGFRDIDGCSSKVSKGSPKLAEEATTAATAAFVGTSYLVLDKVVEVLRGLRKAGYDGLVGACRGALKVVNVDVDVYVGASAYKGVEGSKVVDLDQGAGPRAPRWQTPVWENGFGNDFSEHKMLRPSGEVEGEAKHGDGEVARLGEESEFAVIYHLIKAFHVL